MRIVCLMGNSLELRGDIASRLEKLGYKKIIPYTTRKPKESEINGAEYHFISKDNFNKLINKGIIMEWSECNDQLYGSPHPIGSINNIAIVDKRGYEIIKSIYSKQVIGVYIEDLRGLYGGNVHTENSKKYENIKDKVELVIGDEECIETVGKIVIKILKYISKNN